MAVASWDPYRTFVAVHVAAGSVALVCYWVALLSSKGSDRHRAAGRVLLLLLLAVTASIGPVLLLAPDFAPPELVQFVYLAVCVPTVSMLAYTAIRWKRDVERFRGWHFKTLGVVLFVFGLVVLAAGIASARPLTVLFSWIGLVYGGAMIRFAWMRATPDPRLVAGLASECRLRPVQCRPWHLPRRRGAPGFRHRPGRRGRAGGAAPDHRRRPGPARLVRAPARRAVAVRGAVAGGGRPTGIAVPGRGQRPRSRAAGSPCDPRACVAARTIASAIASAASAPTADRLNSPSNRPVARAKIASPSNGVCTGLMARA